MTFKRALWLILCFFLCYGAALPATAQQPNPKEDKRFWGHFQIGVLAVQTSDPMRTGGGNETIASLNDPDAEATEVAVVPLVDLNYAISPETTVYLTTPIDEFGVRVAVGASHGLSKRSAIDAAVFWVPMHDEWADPYRTGAPREETDVTDAGLDVKWTGIGDSGFELQYRLNWLEVDNDAIGRRIESLRRDGQLHTISAGYALRIGRADVLIPGVDLTLGDIEGDSNRFNEWRLKVNYRRITERYMVNAYAGAGRAGFDTEHPLFDETRQEWGLGGFALLTLFRPFADWERIFWNFGAGGGFTDANIAFFDRDSVFGFTTIGFRF